MPPASIDPILLDRLRELIRLTIEGRLTAAARLARELHVELNPEREAS